MAVDFYRLDTSKPYSLAAGGNKNAVKGCLFTDGIVVGVRVIKIPSDDYEGEVGVTYTFTDDKMRVRSAEFISNYCREVPFYEGQYVMVGFNESISFVMKKFTFVPEDMQKFLKNEAARSDDDFDGLTGELLDIDTSQPIKSLEYNGVYKWLAICLAGMLAIYVLPLGLFILPNLWDEPIFLTFSLIFPTVIIVLIICFSVKYIKRKKRVNEIVRANPYFAWGRVFYTEKTYGGGESKQLQYCYIDKWNERHTVKVNGFFMNKIISPRETAVAYTADGKSVLLESFVLSGEEEE